MPAVSPGTASGRESQAVRFARVAPTPGKSPARIGTPRIVRAAPSTRKGTPEDPFYPLAQKGSSGPTLARGASGDPAGLTARPKARPDAHAANLRSRQLGCRVKRSITLVSRVVGLAYKGGEHNFMNKMSSWWIKPSSFIIFFAFCGLLGVALLVTSAYISSSHITAPTLQGLGIALITTATVAAPITLYGNTLFMSQFRELTVDKLLEMRLAPELAKILRQETFDVDMYENLKWRLSFEAMPGRKRELLKLQARRDYRITNRTYRTRILPIEHSADIIVIDQPEGFVPGYRKVSLSIVSLENSDKREHKEFDATGQEGIVAEFRGRPIIIKRDKHAVMLNCDLELPPRSRLIASISSENSLPASGTEPYICTLPATSMDLTVAHPSWLDIGVLLLKNIGGDSIPPDDPGSPDQAGRIEESWIFNQGFFPGHGIDLRWGPRTQ